jgi:hypothetical protein
MTILGQFNLIDRLSSPPAPKNWPAPILFILQKLHFPENFCVRPWYLYFKFYFRLEMSRTHVRSIK